MGTITAISNLKGGVGKTFAAGQLAHSAAATGRRALLVDADMQGNTTRHFTRYTPRNPPEQSLADVIDRGIALPTRDAIAPTARPGIDILLSGFDELQAVQDTLVGKSGGEMALARALRTVRDDYDHIIIDCRPAIDLISRGALYAADNVVVVVQPEPDAVDGLESILRAIDEIEQYMDKVLPVAGVIINQNDSRRKDHAEVIEHIKRFTAAAEIPLLGQPIPRLADLGKLSVVGLGVDQHPKPNGTTRVLSQDFIAILDQLVIAERTIA